MGSWLVFGPVPAGAPARRSATLPHAVYLPRAKYEAKPLPGSSDKRPAKTGTGWQAHPLAPGTGMLRPPMWGPPGGYGGLACGSPVNSAWYATTEITCDGEKELWFSAGADEPST